MPRHSLYDFDALARDYDNWYATPTGNAHDCVQKSDVQKLLGPAESCGRLLDVGCGTGHWSRFFASLGYTVTGVDIASAMIHVAKRRDGLDGAFVIGDAVRLPFRNSTFDVVAVMATLEFVSDRAAVPAEMARCVKHNGRLLIGTLNRHAPINRRRLADGRKPYVSAQMFSPAELRAMLRRFGTVRMVASDVVQSGSGGGQGNVNGPFIVAEVKP